MPLDPRVAPNSLAVRAPHTTHRCLISIHTTAALADETVTIPSTNGSGTILVDPLGDATINSSDFHNRHDKPLRCWYNALAAVTLDQVQQGDKAENRHNGKYKQWNEGHVPDILHLRLEVDELLEVKCVSPLTKHHAVGRGSARHGGAPASVGHKIAFGNTLEHLHRKILGTDARGSPADGPFDHRTGKGYVAERRGDYYDALKVKKLKVVPLVMETTGGIGHPGRGFLGRLANMGDPKKGGARDNTQYTCWTAPSFAAHHGMCISAECVYADALLLSLGAMRMKSACARA